MLKIKTYSGPRPGYHLLILGGIHGNEIAGTGAAERLIHDLDSGQIKLVSGRLTVMPLCNPKAAEQKCRSVEENLNRVICPRPNPQTYEQRLANEIAPKIAEADFTLDLHSTHCENDAPFAFLDYPDPLTERVIGCLPLPYVLTGWPQIYADSSGPQDLSTLRYAFEQGKSGITVECGYHFAPKAEKTASQVIRQTLIALGLINAPTLPPCPQTVIRMQKFVLKNKPGRLSHAYNHLDPVKKGEILAFYEDGETLTAAEDGYILIPNPEAAVGCEWFYLGG